MAVPAFVGKLFVVVVAPVDGDKRTSKVFVDGTFVKVDTDSVLAHVDAVDVAVAVDDETIDETAVVMVVEAVVVGPPTQFTVLWVGCTLYM